MPGLTITFTDEELATLRATARREQVSMKAYAHATVIERIEQEALRAGYRQLRDELGHADSSAIRAAANTSAARIASEAGE
ncbi:hypothetical protein ABZ468_38085 [Streptomyces sp. NPDC005708]|jgi:hypothetical protein|uniref:hypothetical protein n=1 Tax=Streptomyces sp. NPDC005708 TaxID=3154564 RepID=UPI0033FEA782